MKKLIFLLLLGVIGGVSLTAQAQSANTYSPTTDEIIIKETTIMTPVLKSVSVTPIKAWLADGQVEVLFQANLGAVTITVANEQSSVYSATLTANEGVAAVINTTGWSSGGYTITIVRSNGKTYAGEFEL
jgi:hypothetical protein